MKKKNNVAEMARQANLPRSTVYARIRNGWTLKKALSTPIKAENRTKKHKQEAAKKQTVAKTKRAVGVKTKVNHMVVEKYKGDSTNMILGYGIGIIIVLLITIIIGQ